MGRNKITAKNSHKNKEKGPKKHNLKKNRKKKAQEEKAKKVEKAAQAETKRLQAVANRKAKDQITLRACLTMFKTGMFEEREIRLVDERTVGNNKVCVECDGKLTDDYDSKNHSYYHQDTAGHVCPFCVARIQENGDDADNDESNLQLENCWFACLHNFTRHLNRYEGIKISELKLASSAAYQKDLYHELIKPRVFQMPNMMDKKCLKY